MTARPAITALSLDAGVQATTPSLLALAATRTPPGWPLDQAPIDTVTRSEWKGRQVNLLDVLAENGDPDGCSPYGCRSGSAEAPILEPAR